jgi:hypothetical protein
VLEQNLGLLRDLYLLWPSESAESTGEIYIYNAISMCVYVCVVKKERNLEDVLGVQQARVYFLRV